MKVVGNNISYNFGLVKKIVRLMFEKIFKKMVLSFEVFPS